MGNSLPQNAEGAIGRTFTVHRRTFRITRVLGEGGFAYVFEVVEKVHQKRYAMKRILVQDKASVELAEKEISVMKQCRSPNIIQYKGSTKIVRPRGDGRRTTSEYLILMEYCGGGTLNTHLDNLTRSLSESEVLTIFLDVTRAVKVLHSCEPPICHRDIKLENVLLASDQHWRLCDFGSCTTTSRAYTTKEEISKEEERIQTYTTSSYRSPEMVDLWRRQVVGVKADIWAIGCILYAIAFRVHPFQDSSALQIVNSRVKLPSRTGFSKDFMKLLKCLFRINPEKRPTIFEVEKDVEALLRGDRTAVNYDKHSKRSRHRKVAAHKIENEEEDSDHGNSDGVRHRRRRERNGSEAKNKPTKSKHNARRRRLRRASTPSTEASDDEEVEEESEEETVARSRRSVKLEKTDVVRGRSRVVRKQRRSSMAPSPVSTPLEETVPPPDMIDFSGLTAATPATPVAAGTGNWVEFAEPPLASRNVAQAPRQTAQSVSPFNSMPTASHQDYNDLFAAMSMQQGPVYSQESFFQQDQGPPAFGFDLMPQMDYQQPPILQQHVSFGSVLPPRLAHFGRDPTFQQRTPPQHHQQQQVPPSSMFGPKQMPPPHSSQPMQQQHQQSNPPNGSDDWIAF